MKKRVLVGMSGGVDSSVTAYLLKEQGYEVEGLSFVLWEARSRTDFTTCCSLQAINDAAKTAELIGVKHSQIDVRDEFIEEVIEPFIESYTQGRTPNPCVLCNEFIKFPHLLNWAHERGFDFIATGHYARVQNDESDCISSKGDTAGSRAAHRQAFLLRGIDPKKDQSYFLYVLNREQLDRLVLPLGKYKKTEVRSIARKLGLTAAERPESQEICFIEDKNYFKFISKISPVAHNEGPIVDVEGKIIGTHRGIYSYTVGQRRGIGIAAKTPLYVTQIDHVKNMIHVGPKEMAYKGELSVGHLNWLTPSLDDEFRAHIKVRSAMRGAPAKVTLTGERALVLFDKPQWGPAPGQSAVFYDNDIVMGGGIIL